MGDTGEWSWNSLDCYLRRPPGQAKIGLWKAESEWSGLLKTRGLLGSSHRRKEGITYFIGVAIRGPSRETTNTLKGRLPFKNLPDPMSLKLITEVPVKIVLAPWIASSEWPRRSRWAGWAYFSLCSLIKDCEVKEVDLISEQWLSVILLALIPGQFGFVM